MRVDKQEMKLWITTLVIVFLMITTIIINDKYVKSKLSIKSYKSLKIIDSQGVVLKEYKVKDMYEEDNYIYIINDNE